MSRSASELHLFTPGADDVDAGNTLIQKPVPDDLAKSLLVVTEIQLRSRLALVAATTVTGVGILDPIFCLSPF